MLANRTADRSLLFFFLRGAGRCWAWPLAVAALIASSAETPAWGQVTVEALLGKVVDINPKNSAGIKEGLAKFQEGNVTGAMEAFSNTVKANPELPPAEVLMAKLLYTAQRGDMGRTYLELAVKEHPDDADAYLLLSELALAQRQFVDAEALAEKALPLIDAYTLNPKRKADFSLRAHQLLAAVHENRQQWDKALPQLKKWVELDPKNSLALRRLGQAQFHSGDERTAYATFRSAKEYATDGFNAEVVMAQLYQRKGDKDRAQRFIDEAKKSAASDPRGQLAIAQWYLEIENPAEAKKHAENALRLDRNSLDANLLLGVIARVQADPRTAESFFEKAHLLSPSNFTASNQLALVLAEQPDEDKQRRALEYAQLNRAVHPENTESASTLGWILYRMGRNQDAERVLNEASRGTGLSPDGGYYVARMFHDMGNFAEARRFLDQALRGQLSYPIRKDAKALAAQLAGTH